MRKAECRKRDDPAHAYVISLDGNALDVRMPHCAFDNARCERAPCVHHGISAQYRKSVTNSLGVGARAISAWPIIVVMWTRTGVPCDCR